MPFTGDILNYRSVAVVGTAKNTGKTECLNYIIHRLHHHNPSMAITSVGVDGETCDQVTRTQKPEITIYAPMMFVTSETHFRQRRFTAEIVDVSGHSTALGRLVTARALEQGKVLLSGPADTATLTATLDDLKARGISLTLVDGALSRKSQGSPAVTEAMILTTGAAWSASLPTLVRKTSFLCHLIALPETTPEMKTLLAGKTTVCSVDDQGLLTDLGIGTAFGLEKTDANLLHSGFTLFIPGAVTDKLLSHLKVQQSVDRIRLIVRDFTRVFASREIVQQFLHRGGTIEVMLRTHLLAVCINPAAPDGTLLNSEALRESLSEKIGLPVWDVRKLKD